MGTIWQQSLIDVVEIFHSVQRSEGADIQSISSGCVFFASAFRRFSIFCFYLFPSFFMFFFFFFFFFFLFVLLISRWTINLTEKNTDHIDPPACTRKYVTCLILPLRKYAYSNIYWKLYHQKMKIFRQKIPIFFHISAQNIDCGYSLEPPRRGGSNEYSQSMFWAEIRKIMYTPVNPSFTI